MRALPANLIKIIALLLFGLLILASGIWASLMIFYTEPAGKAVATALAAAFAALTLLTLVFMAFPRRRWRVLFVYGVAFTAASLWWASLVPSNERDWQADVAVLPAAEIRDNLVHVRNVRNFRYRSEFNYIPAYYDRTYDLDKLVGVDLVGVYWMGPQIAHVFLSFAFADGKQLAISIEARKEKGESYSTLRGFFRQYELYYVVADEEDVIKLRTHYRQNPREDVYIYRLKAPVDNARRLFLEYMRQINELNAKPVFYNALTTNCTTSIWMNTHVNPGHLPFHWTMLATGYLPEHAHEMGRLDDKGMSFPDLQKDAYANERALATMPPQDFSRSIRGQHQPASTPRSK